MAEQRKNEASRIRKNYFIDPETAARLASQPYLHQNGKYFNLSYEALKVGDLQIQKDTIDFLKEVTKQFEADYKIICEELNVKNLKDLQTKIFNGIDEWNSDVPDLIASQAQSFLDGIKWNDFIAETMDENFLTGKAINTDTKKKVSYVDIIQNTKEVQEIGVFKSSAKKKLMRQLVTFLDEKGYLKSTNLSKEKALQIFYGTGNTVEGILLFRKAYEKAKENENDFFFDDEEKRNFIETIKGNVLKNHQIQINISGGNAEKTISNIINNLNFKSQNVTSQIIGAKQSESEGYQRTNKVDIVFTIDGTNFGISSKNLKANKEWLSGAFHRATSGETLLKFLDTQKQIQVEGNIPLSKLATYLIVNIVSIDNNKIPKAREIREDIKNITKLYLYAIIGLESSKEILKESKTNDLITNSLIISIPTKTVIPTYLILKRIIKDLDYDNRKINSLPNSSFFDTNVEINNLVKKNYTKEEEKQRRMAIKEMGRIQNNELTYDNSNLMALGDRGDVKYSKAINIQVKFKNSSIFSL